MTDARDAWDALWNVVDGLIAASGLVLFPVGMLFGEWQPLGWWLYAVGLRSFVAVRWGPPMFPAGDVGGGA